jgi:outer membrane scaffolding protein for murein synthesis (MipA/OmpV family)
MILGLLPPAADAQTPSPLQEWQYSGGLILERMFEPTPPDFHAVVGLGAEVQPAYEGSRAYKVRGGPAFDVRYKDMAFVSTGDGIGYNVIHRRGLELGLSVAYDGGRKERLDYSNLRGMGDKSLSAVPKAFVSWVISDRFPAVLRADVRHLLRTGGGTVGDLGFYLPSPGSSEKLAIFVGPSVTVANRRYLRDLYGVTATQSLASGHPVYDIKDAGVDAYGLGVMATLRITRHYLLNFDGAVNRLGHETLNSPIVERASSHVIAVSVDYHW